MKETKNVNVQEVEAIEVEETVVENEQTGKLAKVGGFMKKHGKKVAVGAGVALAGAAVFVVKTLLSAKNGSEELIEADDYDYGSDASDLVEEFVSDEI